MLKSYKRIVSILLTITMVLSVIAVAPFSVSAKNSIKTQAEAVAWLNSQNGATYNLDTSTSGTQCVEFVKAYVNWLINGDPWKDAWGRGTGNAKDIWANSLWAELDWDVYQNTASFVPQPGDIFVVRGYYSEYGHTGVVISSDVNNAVLAESNVDDTSGSGTPVRIRNKTWTGIYTPTYFIRPKFSDGIAQNVDLGTDFYALILNTYHWKPIENVNGELVLGTENKSKTQLWKFERQEDMSYKIISLYDKNVIDLWNFGNTDGTNIGVGGSNDSNAQRWYIRNNGSAYSLIPKCSQNGAMDLSGNNGADGTNIQFYTINGSAAQTFSIYKIENVIEYLSLDIGDGFYAKIVNTNYNMPVENDNGNLALGADEKTKTQLWKFERQNDGTYKIISLHNQNVIDLWNFGNTDGTNIGVGGSNNTNAQRWYIIKNKSGYSLIPKCSQNGAMDLSGNNGADGANIQFWTINESDAQTFSINKIESVIEYLSLDIGDGFCAKIVNTNYNMPVENDNGNLALGADEKTKTQLWKFERQNDGTYKIISLYNQNVIDLWNFGNTDGTNIGVGGSNNTNAQRWYIIKNKSGYSLIPKCSQNGAMDLTNNDGSDGANIQFWTINGSDSQTFSICKIDNVDEYLKENIYGDANDDGDVNIQDATIVQMVVAKFPVENFNEKLADYDQNGEVNIRDATAIQMVVAKLV